MSRGHALLPRPLTGGHQSVTTSGTSARTTSGVGDQTRAVLLTCNEACHYAFGSSSVTATTNDTYLPANAEHYVRIAPSQYVAAIQDSAGGTLHVSELDG